MNKIKKITMVILLAYMSIITISCDRMYYRDGRHSLITIENNSKIHIFVYGSENYPDTTINYPCPTWFDFRVVESGASGRVVESLLGSWWEERFDLKNLQYLSVFIFEKTFLEPHILDENFIVTETMAIQRYDLTLEDLNSLNWTVPYPPDERMKNMKMYPPYGK
ncbi:MAG: hypothetical protein LBS46_00735 [Dysgonamonadaceae bacterium]|jgi:hypothetical protein|nr:hypothetical protein [Dysgonamonadaceae bacterium]